MYGVLAKRRYCSGACKQRAYRRRREARANGARSVAADRREQLLTARARAVDLMRTQADLIADSARLIAAIRERVPRMPVPQD